MIILIPNYGYWDIFYEADWNVNEAVFYPKCSEKTNKPKSIYKTFAYLFSAIRPTWDAYLLPYQCGKGVTGKIVAQFVLLKKYSSLVLGNDAVVIIICIK